jgi:hypothetical protein
MKLLLTICTVLLMASWTCEAFAATATGSFNFDFASDPACSATVTADCIDHFEIWDVTGTPKKLATVALPSPATSPISFNFKVGPPYGSRKWSAVAVAKDGTASDMTAPQSQNTVSVRPGAPASFVVNLN